MNPTRSEPVIDIRFDKQLMIPITFQNDLETNQCDSGGYDPMEMVELTPTATVSHAVVICCAGEG